MKKILILIFALLSLVPLNALNLETILEDKTLAKEIQSTLQSSLNQATNSYTIVGLLYTGPATLVRTNNSKDLSLIQKKGYITYSLRTNNSFNRYTIEIIDDKINSTQDPHRTNIYNVVFRFYKDKVLVKEQSMGVIELDNAGLADEGNFYTNLAVNAFYAMNKFYVLDKEPNTCGAQYDISGAKTVVPPFETQVIVHHTPDCKDHNHCSCPRSVSATRMPYFPAKVSFVIETDACKTNPDCRCPEYIVYED